MSTELYLALFLLGFAIISYIFLDGGDLGMGMLMPFHEKESQQFVLQNIIVTVWDANESWIILIGTLLWGALPGAYATLLPECYPYFILIVLGFIMRALAMEFSHTKKEFAERWRLLFIFSSWLTAIAQGVVAGILISNFVDPNQLNPHLITFLVTLAVLLLYVINGMNMQGIKTTGIARRNAIKFGNIALILFLANLIVLAYLLSNTQNLIKPFQSYIKPALIGIFIVIVIIQLINIYFHCKKTEPLLKATRYLSYITNILIVNIPLLFIYPNITPSLSIEEATNPSSSSMWFLVIGVSLTMPIVIWYNMYAVKIFSGKHKSVFKE